MADTWAEPLTCQGEYEFATPDDWQPGEDVTNAVWTAPDTVEVLGILNQGGSTFAILRNTGVTSGVTIGIKITKGTECKNYEAKLKLQVIQEP